MRNMAQLSKITLNLVLLLAFSGIQAQEILMTSNSLKSTFEKTELEPKEEDKIDFKLPTLLETKSFYSDGQRPNDTFLNIPLTDGVGPGDLQLEGARSVNYFRFMNQRAESTHSFDVHGVLQRSEFSIKLGN